MNFEELAIGGVTLIPLVIGLVQLLKKLNVTGNKLIAISVGISVLIGAAYQLMLLLPVTEPWVEAIIFIVAFALFGLSASGLYSVGSELSKRRMN